MFVEKGEINPMKERNFVDRNKTNHRGKKKLK